MKPLLDLEACECRYPEPGNLFCAAATVGHSYCPTHRAVCCDRVAPKLDASQFRFGDSVPAAPRRERTEAQIARLREAGLKRAAASAGRGAARVLRRVGPVTAQIGAFH